MRHDNVVFRNKGLIDIRGITTFGVCAKDPSNENPIGHFGTGLKYAIAICLRTNHTVTLWRGREKYTFTTKEMEIRGTKFDMVYMNNVAMPFTTELGKKWPLWCAYRELYCNTTDEKEPMIAGDVDGFAKLGHTTFVIEGVGFRELHEERDSVILTTKPLYKLPDLEIHEGTSVGNWLYHKGVRVHRLEKPAMYNYNLTGNIQLTEDRTLANWYDIHTSIAYGISQSCHMGLIRHIIEANEKTFESTIDFTWSFNPPGKVFNKTIEKYASSGWSPGSAYNSSARRLHDRHSPPQRKEPTPIPDSEILPKQFEAIVNAIDFWQRLNILPSAVNVMVAKDVQGVCEAFGGNYYLQKGQLNKGVHYIARAIYECYVDDYLDRLKDDHKHTSMSVAVSDLIRLGGDLLGDRLKDQTL